MHLSTTYEKNNIQLFQQNSADKTAPLQVANKLLDKKHQSKSLQHYHVDSASVLNSKNQSYHMEITKRKIINS